MKDESVIARINDVLLQVESEIRKKRRPETLIEALRYEAENRYVFHALRIARGKLVNDLRKEDVECIRGIGRWFEVAEASRERVDDDNDKGLLRRLYG